VNKDFTSPAESLIATVSAFTLHLKTSRVEILVRSIQSSREISFAFIEFIEFIEFTSCESREDP
jgi:hypothetical protein